MSQYAVALKTYLAEPGRLASTAAAIGKSQAAVSRYSNALRFPDSETARAIEQATSGEVGFPVWQEEASIRFGIAA